MDEQPVVPRVGSPQCATTDVAPWRWLEELGLDADLVEQAGDVLGGRPLPRPGAVAVVGRVDPDQVAADLDDLGLGCVALRHAAHLAPAAIRPRDYGEQRRLC